MNTNKPMQTSDDRSVFKLVFENLYEPLLAYVTTFTHDRQEAKDIVQNCFVILWNKRSELLGMPSLKNYLFTVAHNLYINQYKKKQYKFKVFNELKARALSDRINESETTIEDKERKLALLVENLPPRCKEILLLNKRDGKKYKEISTILNISIKTVESQMRIAFKKIRDGFQNDGLILLVLFKKIPQYFGTK